MDRYEARLKEKDQYIKELVLLCLDNGIISRGMACTYLGCAREDLDERERDERGAVQGQSKIAKLDWR